MEGKLYAVGSGALKNRYSVMIVISDGTHVLADYLVTHKTARKAEKAGREKAQELGINVTQFEVI